MSRVDLLRQNSLFTGLPEEVLEAVANSLSQRTFAKGMVLFHKGSTGQRLYLIESGQVRIFVLSDGGHEITLDIHGPGECFGVLALLDGGPRSAGAVAQERSVTYTLDRKDLLDLMEAYPALARHCLKLISRRLRHLTSLFESLAFLDISGRVASCLLDLAEHHGQPSEQGIVLTMHMSQSELASYAVATRESVNKVLVAFRNEALIRHEGQVLTILDPAGLRRKVRY
jgi:CRP/FNR family transcriptional regulator/CRP/FNR family cyclic AMP-dependent transcriptional regulator